MMHYYWDGYGMGSGWLGPVFGLLLLVVFVVAIVALFRYSPHGPGSASSAEHILKERYAKGEITQAEYDEMKKHLGL